MAKKVEDTMMEMLI